MAMINHLDYNSGFPKMGDPQNGWFMIEHTKQKWMITRGNPISGKLHIILGQSWMGRN